MNHLFALRRRGSAAVAAASVVLLLSGCAGAGAPRPIVVGTTSDIVSLDLEDSVTLADKPALDDPQADHDTWTTRWPLTKKPGYDDLKAYFNIDNGSGKLRGIHAEGNLGAIPILKDWTAPFASMGIERVVALMEAQDVPVDDIAPHAYLVYQGARASAAVPALAESLRDGLPWLRLRVHAGGGSFKSQFKKADRSGAHLALVFADDEAEGDTIQIKPLQDDRDQEVVALDRVAERIASLLDA